MLAEFAQVHAGKLTVVGAGLLAAFAMGPTPVQALAVCGTIALPFPELNREQVLSIELYDADNRQVLVPTPMGEQPFKIEAKVNAALPPLLPRGSSVSVPFSVSFVIPVRPGTFQFRCQILGDVRTLVKLPLVILDPPDGMIPFNTH